MTREAALNWLQFCAMLDGYEPDFFYLTEPIFVFSGSMGVDPIKLKKILESEFVGLRFASVIGDAPRLFDGIEGGWSPK